MRASASTERRTEEKGIREKPQLVFPYRRKVSSMRKEKEQRKR